MCIFKNNLLCSLLLLYTLCHVPQINKADMEYHTIQPRQDTSYAPHGLTYAVTKRADAADSVCQQFRVDGILSCYGDQIKSRDVSFTLVAESG